MNSQPYASMSDEQLQQWIRTSCCFSHPGTYGHECGALATQVAVKLSDLTVSGIFYARRCDKCATIRGGENSNAIRFEPFNPTLHVNQYR